MIRRNVSRAEEEEEEVQTGFLCRWFQHRWSLSAQTERSDSNLSLVWAARSDKWASYTACFPPSLPLIKYCNVCSAGWIMGMLFTGLHVKAHSISSQPCTLYILLVTIIYQTLLSVSRYLCQFLQTSSAAWKHPLSSTHPAESSCNTKHKAAGAPHWKTEQEKTLKLDNLMPKSVKETWCCFSPWTQTPSLASAAI